MQVEKQKECSIWLDDGKIISELKIKRFKHHMGYRKLRGYGEIKRSNDGKNSGDGIHTSFMTPIRRTATQDWKQYVESKGQVPINGDIGIQPDSGMTAWTRFNAGWGNTTWKSPGINATQQEGWEIKDSKYLQKHHMLQVRPARPLQRVMPLQRGKTRKNRRIKEASRTTLCRESIAQRQAYQVCTLTTKQTRTMEK